MATHRQKIQLRLRFLSGLWTARAKRLIRLKDAKLFQALKRPPN